MKSMMRAVVGWSVLALLVLNAGCGASTAMSVGKYAFAELKGAKGELIPIREGSDAALQTAALDFKPAQTTSGARLAPATLLRAVDAAASRVAAQTQGRAKQLGVETDVVYFQSKGLSSGAMLLARMTFRSGAEVVAEYMGKVESESFRAGNEDALAQALLDAVAKMAGVNAKAKS